MEVMPMRKYTTFAELENLLLTAINLPGSSIKDIAAATGIKANTLYKWKTTPVHLSPDKADRLLLYFLEHEPERLELAEKVLS
jgi:transposase-like protein